MASRAYIEGFTRTALGFGVAPGALLKYAAASWNQRQPSGSQPSSALAIPNRPSYSNPRQTYMSARKPQAPAPRHFIRARNPGGPFTPPPWSAEGQLNNAGQLAISAVPAVLSTPAAVAMGGITGVVKGVHGKDSAGVTAAKGLAGAASGLIPGTVGILNTAGGGMSDAIAGAVINDVADMAEGI